MLVMPAPCPWDGRSEAALHSFPVSLLASNSAFMSLISEINVRKGPQAAGSLLFSHPFHCWASFPLPSSRQLCQKGGGLGGYSPRVGDSRFTVGQCFVRHRFSLS